MTLVFGLEGQEGCKVAANILYGFDCIEKFTLVSYAYLQSPSRYYYVNGVNSAVSSVSRICRGKSGFTSSW